MPIIPESGQIVRVRSRQYLVEEVQKNPGDTLVRLSCLQDDAHGQTLEVFWEREIDAKIIGLSTWDSVTTKGFDDPKLFSAYLHTLKWNCVTSTNPELFQSPYRAGIQVKAYQLEPLRKALLQPRVALFIADDVGLGKTIEAGLILREMIMRQKIRRVVISCPPSVVEQWQEEMESRFGLIFQIFDRDYVANKRRERGYGINPWTTHSRFIISHALLRDETYTSSLRDWLGTFSSGSMFILDEAHNAAPASASRYAIDSQLTKTIRDISPAFEHKLFLSATPHNGHSNSFAALLEILDPQRFCRGVPVKSKKLLDDVMVRRLKQDLRAIGDTDFPERHIIPIIIDNLPPDSPELMLSSLLERYRDCREDRLATHSKSIQNTSMLVMTSLQKRLLSSIRAFRRTLKVHKKTLESSPSKKHLTNSNAESKFYALKQAPGYDDERADLSDDDIELEETAQMQAATELTELSATRVSETELRLLAEMEKVAESAYNETDSRIQYLINWISQNLCPDLGKNNARWNNRRVIIFTEYIDTKVYLEQQLRHAIAGSDQDEERIKSLTGMKDGNGKKDRESVKKAFNADPETYPLRILIANDAAREGINLQNYCADLFHFDVPWNPSRMEQRNGRIDRKLQREKEVRCHYFVLKQRKEDRVIDALVRKTKTIQEELGSLSPVLVNNFTTVLEKGISHKKTEEILRAMNEDINKKSIEDELEIVREKHQELIDQQHQLESILQKSKIWLNLDHRHFKDAICASLNLLGFRELEVLDAQDSVKDIERAKWVLPALNEQLRADPTWESTLDTLRIPRKKGQSIWDWRKDTEIRPVVFRDPGSLDGKEVHLHLEHRLVQRLLGRFLSQGFLHNEISRACVCLTDDTIPKIVVLGRLSLYGERASRLHDEILAVAAEWVSPENRGRSKLRPLTEKQKVDILQELEDSLATPRLREVTSTLVNKFKEYASKDVDDLRPRLEERAEVLIEMAIDKLKKRGEKEAQNMKKLLKEQQQRILKMEQEYEEEKYLQTDLFRPDEIKQKEADRRHWQARIKEIEKEIESEPDRIQRSYMVRAHRIEPVGLVYLWPVSN